MIRRRFLRKKGGAEWSEDESALVGVQSTVSRSKSPTGNVKTDVTYALGSEYSNISVYWVYTNQELGLVSCAAATNSQDPSGASIFLVVDYNNTQYLITLDDNDQSLQLVPFTNLSTFTGDTYFNCQWHFNGDKDEFSMYNKKYTSLYLATKNDGTLKTSGTAAYFSRTGAILKTTTLSYSYWYFYADATYWNTYISQSATYKSFLYSHTYTTSGVLFNKKYNYVLTLETSSSLASNDDVFLVVRDSIGDYYLVGHTDAHYVEVSYLGDGDAVTNNGTTLTFTTKANTTTMSKYAFIISKNSDDVCLKANNDQSYYFANPDTIGEEQHNTMFSTTSCAFSYDETNGLRSYTSRSTSTSFGVSAIAGDFGSTTASASAGTTIVYRKVGASWTDYYGALTAGETYALVVKESGGVYYLVEAKDKYIFADTAHTYLSNGSITSGNYTLYSNVTQSARTTGYDLMVNNKYIMWYDVDFQLSDTQPNGYWTIGTDNELTWHYSVTTITSDGTTETSTTTWYTKTFGVTGTYFTLCNEQFSTMADIAPTTASEFTVTAGTNGFVINYGNYQLNVNNNNLALLAVGLEWVYIGDATTPDNSRLWSLSTSTTTYYPEYSNSDLEADTAATDTDCQCYLVQSGTISEFADELVNGNQYVLVFVDGDDHYLACVSGTDIVPVLYENLPSSLTSAYYFTAVTHGTGFYLTNGSVKLGVSNLKLTMGNFDCVWTYTAEEE